MFSYIFDNNYMQNYSGAVDTRSVGSLAGRSIKILNFTNYDVQVYMAGSQLIDVIPAFQYIIMDNQPDLSLTITGTVSSNYKYMNPYVAVRSSDVQSPYEIGSLIHNLVTNDSSQPVPTSSNYYGTGADGVFNSTGNVTMQNPANVPAIYNYTSFTLNTGHTFNFANQAKFIIIYSKGDITINGTLYSANAVTNMTGMNPILINGKQLPAAGNGGAGGQGAWQSASAQGQGGAGGTGNYYAPGTGGGGGGGAYNSSSPGASGGAGGSGYGNAAPGTGGNNATGAPTIYGATLALVAGGDIIINGTVYNAGTTGGRGGDGKTGTSLTNPCGGGGACGTAAGGNGYLISNASPAGGGGGAGGAGGGVVFLFAGGSFTNNGTINVNGGAGGAAGTNGTSVSSGPNPGSAGQAGSIVMYQMGGSLSQ